MAGIFGFVVLEPKQRRRRQQRERQKKKSNRLDKQTGNNFARTSRFFVHFFAVVARLPRENA